MALFPTPCPLMFLLCWCGCCGLVPACAESPVPGGHGPVGTRFTPVQEPVENTYFVLIILEANSTAVLHWWCLTYPLLSCVGSCHPTIHLSILPPTSNTLTTGCPFCCGQNFPSPGHLQIFQPFWLSRWAF